MRNRGWFGFAGIVSASLLAVGCTGRGGQSGALGSGESGTVNVTATAQNLTSDQAASLCLVFETQMKDADGNFAAFDRTDCIPLSSAAAPQAFGVLACRAGQTLLSITPNLIGAATDPTKAGGSSLTALSPMLQFFNCNANADNLLNVNLHISKVGDVGFADITALTQQTCVSQKAEVIAGDVAPPSTGQTGQTGDQTSGSTTTTTLTPFRGRSAAAVNECQPNQVAQDPDIYGLAANLNNAVSATLELQQEHVTLDGVTRYMWSQWILPQPSASSDVLGIDYMFFPTVDAATPALQVIPSSFMREHVFAWDGATFNIANSEIDDIVVWRTNGVGVKAGQTTAGIAKSSLGEVAAPPSKTGGTATTLTVSGIEVRWSTAAVRNDAYTMGVVRSLAFVDPALEPQGVAIRGAFANDDQVHVTLLLQGIANPGHIYQLIFDGIQGPTFKNGDIVAAERL